MTSIPYPNVADVLAATAVVAQHHREQESTHRQAVQDAQTEPAGEVDSGATESTALG